MAENRQIRNPEVSVTTVCLYVILVPILLILPFLFLLPLPLALFPRLILLPVVRLVASGFVVKLTG